MQEFVQVRKECWQNLVAEYAQVRRLTLANGYRPDVELSYTIRIDLAFAELKMAESLDHLQHSLGLFYCWPD